VSPSAPQQAPQARLTASGKALRASLNGRSPGGAGLQAGAFHPAIDSVEVAPAGRHVTEPENAEGH